MRNRILLILLIMPIFGFSQSNLTLEDCKEKARANFPKMQQAELLVKISELKNENTEGNYLPSVELKGQATYQSEVIEINLPVPGFEFDPVSKDQYKIYLDIKQNIWDGGLTKQMKELELAALNANLQKLEIEVNQLLNMVETYYFTVLQIDNSMLVLNAQRNVLAKQTERIASAVNYGAARQKDKMKMEMEQLTLQQKIDELASKKKSVLDVLSVLVGENINVDAVLELPVASLQSDQQLRPELKYFTLQQNQLEQGDKLLQAARNPKFFGFGQAGYGKPGFNMLKNEFDPYYIVGVGLSWHVFDWNATKRNKEINAQQREIVGTLKTDFLQKQEMQLAEVAEKISGLKQQIITDEKMVEGRKLIAETAASELENGSITSTDFLIDLNAETVAKINHEMHKIQLVQAISNYNSILGY